MLLANKVALSFLPLPSVVSVIQIIFAAVTVLVMKYGAGMKIDNIEMSKVKPYALYIVAFVSAIFANMQALSVSNVETVIVFRACTPLATSAIEYIYMGRSLPSMRSLLALCVVAGGALAYCMNDSQVALEGIAAYQWVSLYFVLICFEMTYGKQLTKDIKMDSPTWGPVLYQNLLAILPMAALGEMKGELDGAVEQVLAVSTAGAAVLLFSCVTGTMIGYTGWKCRGIVSATTFTLVGVVNKFLTILINVIIWDKHSSPAGLFAVCCCLLAGTFYRQAPLRPQIDAELEKERREQERRALLASGDHA